MAGKHKVRLGRVISDKMAKTVVVEVEVAAHHPLYNKTIKKAVRSKIAPRLGRLTRLIA